MSGKFRSDTTDRHSPQPKLLAKSCSVLNNCVCSTDAVSVDVEEGLYKSLQDEGVTTITISKRLALTNFHDAELQLYDIAACSRAAPAFSHFGQRC